MSPVYLLSVTIPDTTLVNYGESGPGTNLESEIIDVYSDSSQNVEMVHKADELGNIYTDNSDAFVSSQPDEPTDATDNYESYMNDYTLDKNNAMDQTQSENNDEKFTQPNDAKDMAGPNISEFQQSETADESLNDYGESQMTEEMLMNEREREKKSKKELEEEEREKMQ